MTIEAGLTFWKTMTWTIPILTAIAIGFSQYKINSLEKESELIKTQENNNLQKEYKDEILGVLNNNFQDKASIVHQGFGISAILNIQELNENRRKFILDFGNFVDKNRVSLYLDSHNNLVFRIIDAEGEYHSIKVPQKIHTFSANSIYYFLLEYGYSESYSFMRLFINKNEVARNEMDYKINIPFKITPENMIIGADINKENNGKFTLSFLSVLKELLTPEQRISTYEITTKFHEQVRR